MPYLTYSNEVRYKSIYLFGHKTKYVVNTDGNVFNTETKQLIIPETTRAGYKRLLIYYKGKRRHMSVHRLVAMAFLPNPDNLPEVNHKSGDKSDNSVDNLKWCDGTYNVQHSYDHGLNPSGEGKPNASISNTTAIKIAKCFEENKLTMTEISKLTGTSWRAIKHIRDGETWCRVVKDYDFSKYDILDRKYINTLYNPYFKLTDIQSRVLRGCELLATTTYTISEIAIMVGLPITYVKRECHAKRWNPERLYNGSMITRRLAK